MRGDYKRERTQQAIASSNTGFGCAVGGGLARVSGAGVLAASGMFPNGEGWGTAILGRSPAGWPARSGLGIITGSFHELMIFGFKPKRTGRKTKFRRVDGLMRMIRDGLQFLNQSNWLR
jgi:hypothetical protein